MFLFMWWFCSSVRSGDSTILDPALYLSPSPPLTPLRGNVPDILWTQRVNKIPAISSEPDIENELNSNNMEKESMVGAETFWPRLTSTYGLHSFPIQFHLTGTYGGSGWSGAIGSSYASSPNIRSVFGKPFAGSGYGTYGNDPGLRIFGGNTEVAWSGWGNGKWGHYGKGKK